MRRLGLWKRLRAAPLSRTKLLGSRIASCALIALIVFAVIYAWRWPSSRAHRCSAIASWRCDAFALLTASFGLLIAALARRPRRPRPGDPATLLP